MMKVNAIQFGFPFVVGNTDNILLKNERINQEYLYHYTSFDVLKKIFGTKTLKFNRIDKVNDGFESRIFNEDEIAHLVYVSCFTKNEIESIPMWRIYGKDKHGLRIRFGFKNIDLRKDFIDVQKTVNCASGVQINYFKRSDSLSSDWTYSLQTKNIIYDIEQIKFNPISIDCEDVPGGKLYNLSAMGAVKRREWKYEDECRIIAYLRTARDNIEIPDINYIMIPIKFDGLKSLQIMFNPWMEECVKKDVKGYISSLDELKNVDVSFENSILTNEIGEL